MIQDALSLLPGVFGALPFLPRGKGALILILGGMMVLACSLVWSFVAPQRTAPPEVHTGARIPSARTAQRSQRPFVRPVVAPPRQRVLMATNATWVRAVMSTVSRAGLGRPLLMRSEPLRHVIQLTGCRSCSDRRRGVGCERERVTLEKVMQAFAPRGRVVELSCNTGSPRACTFELRVGAIAK